MKATATAESEFPFFFDVGRHSLFGVMTKGAGTDPKPGVVILSGGGSPTSTNRNRLSVHLCRRLASIGCDALRFDYHGIGESGGIVGGFRLDEPFTGDVESAVRYLRSTGVEDIVLVGSCFGARTALASAAVLPEVSAVVLITPPIRDFEMGERISTRFALELSTLDYIKRASRLEVLRNLGDRRYRKAYRKVLMAKVRSHTGRRLDDATNPRAADYTGVSVQFLTPLETIVKRGARVLLVYGEEDDFWPEFKRGLSGRLGKVLKSKNVELQVLPGSVHGFVELRAQHQVVEVIEEWVPTLLVANRAPI